MALFLVVDTPVRYLLYRFGAGPFSYETVVFVGFGGVAAGTVICWGLLAAGVVRASRGDSIRASLRYGVSDPVARPRSAAVTIGVHGLVVVAGVVLLAVARRTRLDSRWELALFALGSVPLLLLAGTLLVVHQYARADRPLIDPPSGRRPIVRIALAAVLVTSLVGVAGAVRVTETRPIDAAPEPLPDDPADAYATALENTDRRSVSITVDRHHADASNTGITEWRQDRETRRQLLLNTASDGEDSIVYDSAGTRIPPVYLFAGDELAYPTVAGPGYWKYLDDDNAMTVAQLFPSSTLGDWTTVETTDDERVVEATEELREVDGEVRVRVTIDTEEGVVTDGEYRRIVNESAVDDSDELNVDDRHTEYDVETGVSVDRPSELGSPTPAEWAWKLLAY